ncbi:MAG TPA: TetR/AcrR family transcriptional regulator [Polyangiaceae bacterium]|jgi:AcrR family transcriptional regulator|nr:TetR/AcrR family transcriptional regulator [Polyangiaceae bacterium]
MTARTPKTARKPARKQPRQARSQATVTAVLEAAVQVLEREGVDAATTTRIAEVAGVSIGTLYQYFSHRDAIFDALQDREFERALVLMQSVLSDGNLARSPRDTVRAVVKGLAELYASCPGLHRLLAIEGLRVTKAERVYAFDMRVVGIIRHFLAALTLKAAPIRRKNVDAAAFVAFQSVRATMLASLLERPPGLGEAELIEEIADLVLRYLVDAPAQSSRPRLSAAR